MQTAWQEEKEDEDEDDYEESRCRESKQVEQFQQQTTTNVGEGRMWGEYLSYEGQLLVRRCAHREGNYGHKEKARSYIMYVAN